MLKPLWILALIMTCLLAGCANRTERSDASAPTYGSANDIVERDPDEQLFERLRSGQFQLEGALSSIEAAYRATRKAREGEPNPAARDRLQFVERMLDETGRAMAEHGGAEPTLEMIHRDPDGYDRKRDDTVVDANDSLHDLEDALDALAQLKSANPSSADRYEELAQLTNVAIEDIRGVIRALGGQEEIRTGTP